MGHNTVDLNPPVSTGRQGAYDQTYISARQLAESGAVKEFTEEIYPTIWKDHGEGFYFYDLLRMANRKFTVNSNRLTAFVETYDESPCTLGTAVAVGSAKDTIYFKLDSDDYNADGNTYLRLHNTVYFPPQYFTFTGVHQALPVQYKIVAKDTTGTIGGFTAGVGADTVYTAMPLNKLTTVATEIPIGTVFTVGETKMARGTGPVEGVIKDMLQYDFYTTILREGCAIEGGANSYRYKVDGMMRTWDRSMYDAERRLERQQDYLITMGQMNDNTNLVQTSKLGGSNAVLSSMGVFPRVQQYGQGLPITNGGVFEFDDFDAIKEFQEAKGDTSGEMIFGAATDLYSQVEACPFAWVDAGSSPGTDLMTEMGKFGVPFRRFTKNSRNITLCELSSLGRPTGFGAIDSMKKQGIIFSDQYASVDTENGFGNRKKMHLPNIGIGYLAGREMLMAGRGGINEYGFPNSDGYDYAAMDWLTEMMVFQMHADRAIHVYEAGATS